MAPNYLQDKNQAPLCETQSPPQFDLELPYGNVLLLFFCPPHIMLHMNCMGYMRVRNSLLRVMEYVVSPVCYVLLILLQLINVSYSLGSRSSLAMFSNSFRQNQRFLSQCSYGIQYLSPLWKTIPIASISVSFALLFLAKLVTTLMICSSPVFLHVQNTVNVC